MIFQCKKAFKRAILQWVISTIFHFCTSLVDISKSFFVILFRNIRLSILKHGSNLAAFIKSNICIYVDFPSTKISCMLILWWKSIFSGLFFFFRSVTQKLTFSVAKPLVNFTRWKLPNKGISVINNKSCTININLSFERKYHLRKTF